ncbi:hypothetical protein [Hymenobacter bucti]|uniref:Uncharacterized protein n=1 Tax=Hymenobacter bucti TaxID=1844114 RepID=A0ABW4QY15_9BACT
MEYLLRMLAHHWGLSQSQYWHLHLLSSVSLGPLLGILYLVVFDRRARRRAHAAAKASMWVGADGRLLIYR